MGAQEEEEEEEEEEDPQDQPNDDEQRAKIVEGRFTILEKSKLVRFLTRAMMIFGVLFALSAATGVFGLLFLGAYFLILGIAMSRSQKRNNFSATRRERHVRVTHEGIWVNNELEIPRDKIGDGFFQPRVKSDPTKRGTSTPSSSVRILNKHEHILFEMETDEPKALAVLHALGLDPKNRRAEFRGASPLHSTVARNLTWTFGSIALFASVGVLLSVLGVKSFFPFVMLLIVPLMALGMLPSRIEVGIDGIHEQWLWRKRFIPMSQITRATPVGAREIRIELASGKFEMLSASTARSSGRAAGDLLMQRRDAILARIHEARAAYETSTSAVDVSALVRRGSRTAEQWLSALVDLRHEGGNTGGYRDAIVREEDLWRLVEDPAAPEDARAGAALALRRALGDEGKSRVRVASSATASPKLRVAFDAVIGDSDDAVTRSLHELTQEEEAQRVEEEQAEATRDERDERLREA